MTRERIKALIQHTDSPTTGELEEIARLALVALDLTSVDSERARRVGEAVLSSCGLLVGAESLAILDLAVAEYREKKMVFAAHVVGAVAASLRGAL